jgi:hypothetical protein
MAFIDEGYEPGMKDYQKSPKKWYSNIISKPETVSDGEVHKQYRNWQINQPLFDGRGSWKAMSDDELSFITSTAGPMLVEFGYTKTDNSESEGTA